MSENYGYIEAFKSYRQAQTKYDYFFIGVILASLSLSLQITTTGMCSLYLLFFSWVSLAISLLFGLFRIEQINNFLRVEANSLAFTQNKSKIGIANVKSSTEIWGQEDLTNAVSRIDDNLAFSDKLMLVFNKHAIIAYQI